MTTVLRSIGAVVAATIVAFVMLIAVELFSAIVYPMPPDFKGTMEEMCKHVEHYPHWVLAVVVPLWAGTAFASTWIARRLGSLGSGVFVGVLLLAGLLFNVAKLPYPIWFKIVSVITVLPAIWLGCRSLRRGETAAK